MPNFHRFVDPIYDLFAGESFPAALPLGGVGTIGPYTYDRINVVTGGTGAGGSASADTKKGAGVNIHTYFVAWGEDGTSSDTNRGFRALAENSDAVDTILRTNTPKFGYATGVSVGAAFIDITDDVFVGDPSTLVGDVVTVYNLATGGRLETAGGVPIIATDVQITGGGASKLGTGWYTNPRVTLSAVVPVGLNYILVYGKRTSTARVVEIERQVHFSREIADLAYAVALKAGIAGGLDERYRRLSTMPLGTFAVDWMYDTPGSGSDIYRDGKAVVVTAFANDWLAAVQVDPYLSSFRTELDDYTAISQVANYSGETGFTFLTSLRHRLSDAGELSSKTLPLSAFTVLNKRSVNAALVGANAVYTRLAAGFAASLSGSQISVSAPSQFHDGANTSIFLKSDLLELVIPGVGTQSYIIESFVANDTAELRTMGGATPAFPPGTLCTGTWLQPTIVMGGTGDGTNTMWPLLGFVEPTSLSAAALNAARQMPEFVGNGPSRRLLTFGRFTKSGASMGNRTLTGTIDSSGYSYLSSHLNSALVEKSGGTSGAGAAVTLEVKPAVDLTDPVYSAVPCMGYSNYYYRCTTALGAPCTITVNATTPPLPGERFTLFVINVNGAALIMNWSAAFVFSGLDRDGPLLGNQIFKWEGIASVVDGIGLKYYMTRTVY